MQLLKRTKEWMSSAVDTRLVGSMLRWLGFLYHPLDDRLRPREAVARAWRRPIYRSLGWLKVFGPTALFLVLILSASGVLLAFHYDAHPDTSRTSVLDVTAAVTGGWLVRGIHYWAARLLIVLVVIHAAHAFFTRAYRAPRHANWVIGLAILPVMFGLHFSGSVLPWDHDAYWSAARMLKLGSGLPIIGAFLGRFAQEAELSHTTLGRAYALHVVLLPWTLFLLLTVHLRLVWRRGLTPPLPPPGGEPANETMVAVLRADTTAAEALALRRSTESEGVRLRESELEGRAVFQLEGCKAALAEKLSLDPRVKEVIAVTAGPAARTFYPHHFFRLVCSFLAVFGALILLAAWLPPSIKGPADSFHPPESAPLPWYALWFRGLQEVLPHAVGSILIVLATIAAVIWPMLDAHVDGRPRRPWLAPVAGIVALVVLVALSIKGAGQS